MKCKIKFLAQNHCTIRDENGIWFQSYNSICAFKDNSGKITLFSDWNYSRTTLKYLKIFLNTTASKQSIEIAIGLGKINYSEEF